MTDAELLNAALPWVEELLRNTRKTGHGRAAAIPRVPALFGGADTRPFALLRRNMLGVMISIPATAIALQKIAQDFPDPEAYQVMDDYLLLFAAYSPDETINDPEMPPPPANSSRKLSPA